MKKNFMAMVALFAAGTALANSNMTWEQIKKDSNLLAAFPMIGFKYASVSVDAVCVDGDKLRPFKPAHEHCVAWDNNSENPACVETETVLLSAPIRYSVVECAEWDNNSENPSCVRHVTLEKVRPLTYKVEVYDSNIFGGEGGRSMYPLFTKSYTIPACN